MAMMAGKARPWVLLKWLPLTVLSLAAVVGAWFGATAGTTSTAAAPTGLWQIIASTRAAGTARLAYSTASVGPTPLLSNTIVGGGVVDFTSNQYRTVSIQHSTEISSSDGGPERLSPSVSTDEEVFYKGHVYERIPGAAGLGEAQWIRFPTLSEIPPIVFGSFDQSEATEALRPLSEPHTGLSLVTVGRQSIDGIRATHYRATLVPQRCDEGLASLQTPIRIDLWVDGEHRIVQARSTTSTSYTRPEKGLPFGLPSYLNGTVVMTSTLHIYDYGAHVLIDSPEPILRPGGSGFAVLSSRCPHPGRDTK